MHCQVKEKQEVCLFEVQGELGKRTVPTGSSLQACSQADLIKKAYIQGSLGSGN